MRIVTLSLIALIALVHAELWIGRGSVPHVMELSTKLADQQEKNATARMRNEQIAAEVNDLREGLEMVEERARYELGMVRADEILVQVSTPKR